MKLGISIKIDVSKIDKSRLFKGEKGTYLDLTTFIDPENPSEYGDHGIISQSVSKEERDNKVQMPIIGNAKVFFTGESQPRQGDAAVKKPLQQQSGASSAGAIGASDEFFDDSIPW